MSVSQSHRHDASGPVALQCLLGAALAVCACFGSRIAAELPPVPPACPIGGLPACLPPLPDKAPRPPAGPEAVTSFIDSLSVKDGVFEVVVGQGRILTTKEDIAAPKKGPALIAVGNPYIIDFVVLSPRQVRIIGLRLGTTDLSITTSDNRTYSLEVRVVADLDVLRGQLKCLFPDASIRLGQIRDHVVVEGEARDNFQIARILETIRAYLISIRGIEVRTTAGNLGAPPPPAAATPARPPGREGEEAPPPKKDEKEGAAVPKLPRDLKPVAFEEAAQIIPPVPGAVPPVPGAALPGGQAAAQAGYTPLLPYSPGFAQLAAGQTTIPEPQIINLLRVPGAQQVLLKVRIAELNRTAMRQIGADFLVISPNTGNTFGTQIGGAGIQGNGTLAGINARGGSVSNVTTLFTILTPGEFQTFFSALRRNSLLKVLAEPNLIAMNGHQADFLAGGEFPVPVPQAVTGGAGTTVTVQFRQFGVRLAFVPYILDNEIIRLAVDPEVSSIDTTLGTTLVPGGSPVPGLDTRKAHTVVEMRQGQTLAIAGLLQLTLNSQTSRIPGLGDLPILGPFFSNTTDQRMEKELVVLVTPYLIGPMNPGQVPPMPGDEVNQPNDLEFYFLNRIEGRTGRDWRATTDYDGRLLRHVLKLEQDHMQGPHGFSDGGTVPAKFQGTNSPTNAGPQVNP